MPEIYIERDKRHIVMRKFSNDGVFAAHHDCKNEEDAVQEMEGWVKGVAPENTTQLTPDAYKIVT